MKYNLRFYAIIALVTLFAACQNATNVSTESSASSTSSSPSAYAESSPSESSRSIIKTAEIKFQVDDVATQMNQIQTSINKLNGHVMHYEINSNKTFHQEVSCSLDSSEQIYQLNPEGFMKVRVPLQQSDSFIHTMIAMNARIDKLLIDEEDVTEDLHAKKDLIDAPTVIVDDDASLKKQQYADTKSEQQIERKAEFSKLKYKTAHLWFDIYLQGKPTITRDKVLTIKNIHEPFNVHAIEALSTGWYAFSMLLLALLNIWPFVLLAIVLFIAYKRKWLYRFGLKRNATGAF